MCMPGSKRGSGAGHKEQKLKACHACLTDAPGPHIMPSVWTPTDQDQVFESLSCSAFTGACYCTACCPSTGAVHAVCPPAHDALLEVRNVCVSPRLLQPLVRRLRGTRIVFHTSVQWGGGHAHSQAGCCTVHAQDLNACEKRCPSVLVY